MSPCAGVAGRGARQRASVCSQSVEERRSLPGRGHGERPGGEEGSGTFLSPSLPHITLLRLSDWGVCAEVTIKGKLHFLWGLAYHPQSLCKTRTQMPLPSLRSVCRQIAALHWHPKIYKTLHPHAVTATFTKLWNNVVGSMLRASIHCFKPVRILGNTCNFKFNQLLGLLPQPSTTHVRGMIFT